MPPVFALNVIALFVFVVQLFTGAFIKPEIQIFILGALNWFGRTYLGRDIYTGKLVAAVATRYNITTKRPWESKMFWAISLGCVGGYLQWQFGWIIPAEYYLVVVSAVVTLIAKITKKPVTLHD